MAYSQNTETEVECIIKYSVFFLSYQFADNKYTYIKFKLACKAVQQHVLEVVDRSEVLEN